ncbi:MAG: response regulator transcription factor [Microthrixaceae bacterium]
MAGESLVLVDDDDNLRSMLDAALSHNGYEVTAFDNGRSALEVVPEVAPDLVVPDVMMPDLDGFEVCRRLRSEGNKVPVLFLTARDTVEDKVRGLTLGGDDYLVKPFSLEELVARVQALLRRAGAEASDSPVLRCADLELDDDASPRASWWRGCVAVAHGVQPAAVPDAQPGRAMSKAQILDHVWQYDFGGDGGVVETYIGYLRRKLDTGEPKLIHTIRGVGYTLREG